jgi:hypothetical protein
MALTPALDCELRSEFAWLSFGWSSAESGRMGRFGEQRQAIGSLVRGRILAKGARAVFSARWARSREISNTASGSPSWSAYFLTLAQRRSRANPQRYDRALHPSPRRARRREMIRHMTFIYKLRSASDIHKTILIGGFFPDAESAISHFNSTQGKQLGKQFTTKPRGSISATMN